MKAEMTKMRKKIVGRKKRTTMKKRKMRLPRRSLLYSLKLK